MEVERIFIVKNWRKGLRGYRPNNAIIKIYRLEKYNEKFVWISNRTVIRNIKYNQETMKLAAKNKGLKTLYIDLKKRKYFSIKDRITFNFRESDLK